MTITTDSLITALESEAAGLSGRADAEDERGGRDSAENLRITINWINRAIAALRAREPEQRKAWQPIDTAPKDGTSVLVMMAYSKEPIILFWNAAFERWIHFGVGPIEPSVWHPLPRPYQQRQPQEEGQS